MTDPRPLGVRAVACLRALHDTDFLRRRDLGAPPPSPAVLQDLVARGLAEFRKDHRLGCGFGLVARVATCVCTGAHRYRRLPAGRALVELP